MQAEFAKIRRQVSFEQLIELLKLVKEHPELYRVSARPSLAIGLQGFWNKCAETLNFIKGGAFKDAYGWSQYWRYYKFRIKKRTIELTSDTPRTKVPADDYVPLAQLDEIILSLLRDSDDGAEEENDNGSNPKDKEAGKTDGVGKATSSTSTNNAETVKTTCVRKRRYSATDMGDVERAKLTPLDMRQRYRAEASLDSNRTTATRSRKRRHAFNIASNAIGQYFKSKPLKKNITETKKRKRGSKRRRSPRVRSKRTKKTSLCSSSGSAEAASIRYRRHTFTNMNVAKEQDLKNKSEQQTTDVSDDPEEIEQREIEEFENMTLINDSLLRVTLDSIRMVAIMNTAKEILNNNPALQQTVYTPPTIF